MKSKILEADIEAKFQKAVKAAGGKAYKFVSPGTLGVPDRMVVFPGRVIGYVELKRPGEKPRPTQQKQINYLQSLGFYVTVLDSLEGIPNAIREIKEQRPYEIRTS